ncbi:MAG: ribonuclease H [Candidatus Saccharibacteria bacterium]|nr:ribonuclease H [Candidatus Saccharibacteria bacterium]
MKILWTDGSAEPNPGPGGWAVIDEETKSPAKLGNAKHTTNIQMEGTALKEAIKYAGNEGCEIHTDSEFWVNVLTKWAPSWEKNNWKKKSGPIKNLELVQELYKLYQENNVKLIWTRGHVGTELNELADTWATKARLNEKIK